MTTTPGAQDAPDPRRVHVSRVPTPAGDAVELDLGGDPQLLVRLARAVFRMGLTIAWRRVGALPLGDPLHAPALAALQRHPAVRGALRLRLTPAEAVRLAGDIDLALISHHPTVVTAPAPRDRYAQCDATCTTDCGACKGAGVPGSEVCS